MTSADFHYDEDADSFIICLADGTELCRTRAPHTAVSKAAAEMLVEALQYESQFEFAVQKPTRTLKYTHDAGEPLCRCNHPRLVPMWPHECHQCYKILPV